MKTFQFTKDIQKDRKASAAVPSIGVTFQPEENYLINRGFIGNKHNSVVAQQQYTEFIKAQEAQKEDLASL